MFRKIAISAGRILAFLALWAALLSAATFAVVQLGGPNFYQDMGWRTALEGLAMLATLVAFLVMALAVDRRGVGTLGFPPDRAFAGLIGGTLIGAAIFAVPLAILSAQGYIAVTPDFAHFTPGALAIALLLVFVNVIDQELIVRSYIFQEVWRKYSGTAAVTVSTVIFVALHAGAILKGTAGLLAGANVALASILLGLAYLRSRALWLPIGIHFGWNAFQGPVLGINVTGMDLGAHWHVFVVRGSDLWTGGTMGVEGGLAGLAGPLLGIAVVLALYRQPHAAPSMA
jgi:membrane protease YdiL (CAAX protease family)